MSTKTHGQQQDLDAQIQIRLISNILIDSTFFQEGLYSPNLLADFITNTNQVHNNLNDPDYFILVRSRIVEKRIFLHSMLTKIVVNKLGQQKNVEVPIHFRQI